jgi:hypothetical protein
MSLANSASPRAKTCAEQPLVPVSAAGMLAHLPWIGRLGIDSDPATCAHGDGPGVEHGYSPGPTHHAARESRYASITTRT